MNGHPDFTIKSGGYCPVCKGMVIRDCSHSMTQLRQAVSGIAPASRVELDAAKARLAEAEATLKQIFDYFGPPQDDCECIICELQRKEPTT